MAIKRKVPAAKKGTNYSYDAKTFMKDHKMPNSFDTDNAEDVLNLIKPFELFGRKFIVLDTEDYALPLENKDFGTKIVRRWVGTGKKAVPVDIPFCISLCDGVNMITLYDSLENGYREIKKLAPILEDPTIEKIYHNTKFDMHMLANVGIKMCGKLHDTVVLAKIVDENRFSFQLKDIASRNERGVVKYEYMVDAYKKTYKVTDYRMIPRELLTEYANADVWNAYILFMDEFTALKKMAEQDNEQSMMTANVPAKYTIETLYDNELELMIALWSMERHGMRVAADQEKPLKEELQRITDEAERAVYDAVGYVFNMNSNPQIHKAMLSMGVDGEVFRYTDKGNVKLDKKEFDRLESLGIDLVIKIAQFRKAEKLLNTYAVGIYDQRDENYKVHGSINQTEATTGRMSITKPALQTLPKRDKRIRSIFIPSPGYLLAFMDLDQVEYRGLAHYSKAVGLIETIKAGIDVHLGTAQLILNKPLDQITDEERDQGKTLNFSLVYGQGDAATAVSLKTNLHDARIKKMQYFDAIPEVQPFIRNVHNVIRARGYIKNYYGRRRRLESDFAYKAPNSLIQGWAADYIKHKLVLMYKFLCSQGAKSRLINVVHDEVIPEVHETERHLLGKLRYLLSDFNEFRVPITAGAEISTESWGAKQDISVDFEPLTEEEWAALVAYDVFDGSVFDLHKEV